MMNVVKNIMSPNLTEFTSQERSKSKCVYLKDTVLKVGPNLGDMISEIKTMNAVGKCLSNVLRLEIVQVWFVVKEK